MNLALQDAAQLADGLLTRRWPGYRACSHQQQPALGYRTWPSTGPAGSRCMWPRLPQSSWRDIP